MECEELSMKCPPPPELHFRPPPDPTEYFQELGLEWPGLNGECAVIPISTGGVDTAITTSDTSIDKLFQGFTQFHRLTVFITVPAVILLCFILTIVCTILCVKKKRLGKPIALIKTATTSESGDSQVSKTNLNGEADPEVPTAASSNRDGNPFQTQSKWTAEKRLPLRSSQSNNSQSQTRTNINQCQNPLPNSAMLSSFNNSALPKKLLPKDQHQHQSVLDYGVGNPSTTTVPPKSIPNHHRTDPAALILLNMNDNPFLFGRRNGVSNETYRLQERDDYRQQEEADDGAEHLYHALSTVTAATTSEYGTNRTIPFGGSFESDASMYAEISVGGGGHNTFGKRKSSTPGFGLHTSNRSQRVQDDTENNHHHYLTPSSRVSSAQNFGGGPTTDSQSGHPVVNNMPIDSAETFQLFDFSHPELRRNSQPNFGDHRETSSFSVFNNNINHNDPPMSSSAFAASSVSLINNNNRQRREMVHNSSTHFPESGQQKFTSTTNSGSYSSANMQIIDSVESLNDGEGRTTTTTFGRSSSTTDDRTNGNFFPPSSGHRQHQQRHSKSSEKLRNGGQGEENVRRVRINMTYL